jgi:ribosomal protein L28
MLISHNLTPKPTLEIVLVLYFSFAMFPTPSTLLEVVSTPFKRSQLGLFHGKTKLSGNNVPFSKKKTRRTWLPNVQNRRLFSEALDKKIELKVTMRALKTIEKVVDSRTFCICDGMLTEYDTIAVWRLGQLRSEDKVGYPWSQRHGASHDGAGCTREEGYRVCCLVETTTSVEASPYSYNNESSTNQFISPHLVSCQVNTCGLA